MPRLFYWYMFVHPIVICFQEIVNSIGGKRIAKKRLMILRFAGTASLITIFTLMETAWESMRRDHNPYIGIQLAQSSDENDIQRHMRLSAVHIHPDKSASPLARFEWEVRRKFTSFLLNPIQRNLYDRFGDISPAGRQQTSSDIEMVYLSPEILIKSLLHYIHSNFRASIVSRADKLFQGLHRQNIEWVLSAAAFTASIQLSFLSFAREEKALKSMKSLIRSSMPGLRQKQTFWNYDDLVVYFRSIPGQIGSQTFHWIKLSTLTPYEISEILSNFIPPIILFHAYWYDTWMECLRLGWAVQPDRVDADIGAQEGSTRSYAASIHCISRKFGLDGLLHREEQRYSVVNFLTKDGTT